MLQTKEMLDLSHSLAGGYLSCFPSPWQALDGIRDLILALGPTLDDDYIQQGSQIWIHKTARVAPSASITGPCILGPGTEVRHCAFIRGNALVGANCVVGNSTELKNVILFDEVQVPHFNYVGDSILGYRAHLGAGAVTSNVRSDRSDIVVRDGPEQVPTGRRKFGAVLGDLVEVGCNSVLNPGTLVGRGSSIYPTSCVRGVVPAHSIHKQDGTIVPIV